MPDAPYDDVFHRWTWFRRDTWWPVLRDELVARRGKAFGAVLEVLADPAGKAVLDATCGLGRRTLVLHRLGLDVTGADASAYAVERARELAAGDEAEVALHVAAWRELPEVLERRFDGVTVDAFVDCLETADDLEAALRGVRGVLKPGGSFIFVGPEPGQTTAECIELVWACGHEPTLAWQHERDDIDCACVSYSERGPDFVDDQFLYVVREAGATRLERATMRRWFRWEYGRLAAACEAAGFARLSSRTFSGGYSRLVAEAD